MNPFIKTLDIINNEKEAELRFDGTEIKVTKNGEPIELSGNTSSMLILKFLIEQSRKAVNVEKVRQVRLTVKLEQLQDTILTRKAQLELSALNSKLEILKRNKLIKEKAAVLSNKESELDNLR